MGRSPAAPAGTGPGEQCAARHAGQPLPLRIRVGVWPPAFALPPLCAGRPTPGSPREKCRFPVGRNSGWFPGKQGRRGPARQTATWSPRSSCLAYSSRCEFLADVRYPSSQPRSCQML